MATSTPPNPDILTGNDAIIKINGIAAGYMKSLSVNINNNVEAVRALGYRKPRGLKSMQWSGTAGGEFHILRTKAEGVIPIDTHDDDRADDLYQILVIDKKSMKRIGQLTGAVQTDGFDLNNNAFSGRRLDFELMDWEPMEGYN